MTEFQKKRDFSGNLHPNASYGAAVLDTVQSLQSAIIEAGGAIAVTPDWLKTTTAQNLILLLASNGVRFYFDKDKVS